MKNMDLNDLSYNHNALLALFLSIFLTHVSPCLAAFPPELPQSTIKCRELLEATGPLPTSQVVIQTSSFQFITESGFRNFPVTAQPRISELVTKKETLGLSAYEEGELRGLFAHRDNPEAAILLQKEYLNSQGILAMEDSERERLRQIRADIYYGDEETPRRSSTPESHVQAMAGANELKVLSIQAKIARLKDNWPPSVRELLRHVIESTPDEPMIFSKNSLANMPPDSPSELELYFLSLIDVSDIIADNGYQGALRIMESIRCLRDRIRTKKFLIGLIESVEKIDAENRPEITVLDAGTGAIPILAIQAALLSEKVRVTALELNPQSAAIAKRIIQALGLQNQISVIHTDATTFRSNHRFDLVISETMHSGLTAEPIVQIFSNLRQYVKEDGITLPGQVRVYASLVPLDAWMKPVGYVKIYRSVHHVVSTDWIEVARYRPGDNLDEIDFEISTERVGIGNYFIFVTSEVDIGSQRLRPYQSLITMPQAVRDSKSDPFIFDLQSDRKQKQIRVRYRPGQMLNRDPKLEISLKVV